MSAESYPSVSPRELEQRRGADVTILDVRTPAEFRSVHAVGARNVPLDELDLHLDELRELAAAGPLPVICQAGGRSRKACEKLSAAGLSVVNVDGGTTAWADSGLPVVRGKQTISLERQVRIAAGTLVLTGALLAWFVNPLFVWLSAFVGGGLLFAGLTDTCGMGMLLAKMPWNRA